MGCPELIVMGITQPHEVLPLLAEADVIVMGPGLGRSVWATQLLSVLWTAPQPLIVDADALNALAVTGHRRSNWCLTPHAGEAARLLGCSARAIQEERLQSVNALVTRYGGVVVLKGPSTLIAAEELSVPMVCERGNPGMATAGMGDVLCGVIAAIAAQQALPAESLAQSAAVGVEVHARAADMAAGTLERGLIARDVIAHLRVCVNPAC
jgi:NAD(P)H-hydrate epimerase